MSNEELTAFLQGGQENTPVSQTSPDGQGMSNEELTAFLQGGQPALSSSSWNEFKRLATGLAQEKGFPANVLLGQAALESARGTAAPGNNYFGIKGQGTAGTNNLPTQEYGTQGYYNENSDFAAYNTPEDSINAYLNLVMGYPGVSQSIDSGNPLGVLQAIKNAGYATSPTYVTDVANTPEFKGGY